jgi:Uma2 family endonuclease
MNVLSTITRRKPLPLTVNDYRILHEAGAFVGRPRVELIEGVILTVNSQLRWHLAVKSGLSRRLGNKLEEMGLQYRAYCDGTVALSDDSAPDPDILIASDGPADEFVDGGVTHLIVEVADTSLRFDLGRKRLLYARGAIPEYWVVSRRSMYRFWMPEDGDYRQRDKMAFGQPMTSITIPCLTIESDGLI